MNAWAQWNARKVAEQLLLSLHAHSINWPQTHTDNKHFRALMTDLLFLWASTDFSQENKPLDMTEAWTSKSWFRDLYGIKFSPGPSLSHSQHQSLDSELPILLLAPLFLDPAQSKFRRAFLNMYNSWFRNYLALGIESSELVFKVTRSVRPMGEKILQLSTFLENKKQVLINLLGIIPFPWLCSGPGNNQKHLSSPWSQGQDPCHLRLWNGFNH